MAGRREDWPEDAAPGRAWRGWFAWGWVLLVVLAAAARLFDLERLRLALDLTRAL